MKKIPGTTTVDNMAFPVRCFTCNKVIGALEKKYFGMLDEGFEPKDALDVLNVKRICCRRMFLGYVNIIDHLLLFPNPTAGVQKSNPETEK